MTKADRKERADVTVELAAGDPAGFQQPIAVKKPPAVFRFLNPLSAWMGRKNESYDVAAATIVDVNDPQQRSFYQQSATRKLAFGGPTSTSFTTIQDEKKQKNLHDFYNNSTLTRVAKLFSFCVLICAFFMLVRELFHNR
ncbi:hypothetical protein M3Y99_01005400 [Aphelenchoides fujianensis]|nr:hypothetical protein M3Y99_01168100 [Aphelenchoides fujianensis]KAI6232590.1 hypothetical protein M3Y99_01005400 [Aphelenchoides fujianensis]